MSAALEDRVDPALRLARIQAEIEALQRADLSALSDDALLDYGRDKERLSRQFATLDHAFVAEVTGRDLPGRNLVRPVPFLRGLFRIDPREAAGRLAAAEAAGPRRALTGEILPPVFPAVAAAQAAGEISERHARLIVDTIEKLPDEAQAEHGEQIEADLVGYAGRFDPHQLATIAKRVRYCYDQDGSFDEDLEHRAKQRGFTINQRPDGSVHGTYEGTAEFGEFLLTTFDALGKPLPEVDGFKDPRTAAQRRHDALLEALRINVRARALPSIAGVTATIVLTMTAEGFETRKGLAKTSHGALIPVPEAMRISGREYRLMNLVIDKTRGITAYSSTARLYPENARLALNAHYGGCTFPHCNAPPGWCQIDHIHEWALTGITDIDDGGPACPTHNVQARAQGWKPVRIGDRIAWIPPRWIDPEQKPQYNELHNTDIPRD